MDMTALPAAQGAACRFCSLLTGTKDAFDSLWLSEDHYRAIVSVGAFVPGWTLVCPTEHVVNLSGHYKREDFWAFTSTAAHVLEASYGRCAYFEHGASSSESLTGCGVGHAHGHLVPLNFSLEAEVLGLNELNWLQCSASEIRSIAKGNEYLFVATAFAGAKTRGSLCLLEAPISQFFLRVIARQLGIADMYDYKKYPMFDIAAESARKLRIQASATLARI